MDFLVTLTTMYFASKNFFYACLPCSSTNPFFSLIQAHKHNFLEGECITIAGPSVHVQCIFPFEFNGKVYYDCALDSDGYWCSTKVDSTGTHIGGQGNWGTCGQDCMKGKIY